MMYFFFFSRMAAAPMYDGEFAEGVSIKLCFLTQMELRLWRKR